MRKEEIRRIVVRGPNWLGDAVMCEPALSQVRTLSVLAWAQQVEPPLVQQLVWSLAQSELPLVALLARSLEVWQAKELPKQ